MRKLFALIIFLFLSTSVYASQLTTNYNLEIPAIGDRDWQPIISKDIISIDTVVGIISSDSIKIKFISSDVADLKLKTTIISNDISYYPIKIISHDIQIISADVAVHKLSIDVISDDVSFVRYYKLPRVPPTGNAVISYDGVTLGWKPIYDQTAFSLPLSVANGGTGSAIGYTVVSNDIAYINPNVRNISADAVNSFIKGWVNADAAGTRNDYFNVSGITDTGTGKLTVTWDKDFASTNYVIVSTVLATTDTNNYYFSVVQAIAVGSCVINCKQEAGAYADPVAYYVLATGDQ